MLIKIILGLVVLVAVVLTVAAFQPGSFQIERRATIAAPASSVFPHVNDFRKWQAWSPWEKMDPSLTRTYDGPGAGVGASYHWIGNSKVGEGRMTIIETRANELIRIKLEFLKPFPATNTGEFTFMPQGSQTAVAWRMSGTTSFICKVFGLVMNMDKMIGGEFEKGLTDLKSLAEAGPKTPIMASK